MLEITRRFRWYLGDPGPGQLKWNRYNKLFFVDFLYTTGSKVLPAHDKTTTKENKNEQGKGEQALSKPASKYASKQVCKQV